MVGELASGEHQQDRKGDVFQAKSVKECAARGLQRRETPFVFQSRASKLFIFFFSFSLTLLEDLELLLYLLMYRLIV